MAGRQSNIRILLAGLKDGLPIGAGYFAVAFSLGIAARSAGITALQGFVMSALNNASSGEYAGIAAIRSSAPYWELAALMVIANARYLLMSTALSQRLSPETSIGHRMLIGFNITDELFGIGVARPYPLEPLYLYGAYLFTIPCWASGTALGIEAGNLLPPAVTEALSAAIFGMFIAVVVPPGRKNRTILAVVLISFSVSIVFSMIPGISGLSESMRIIILTLAISSAAALLKPVPAENGSGGAA